MLETTLAARFAPSANLKGQVAGANWLFLLPTLPLVRTICLGVPSRATLTSLAKLCQEVTVLTQAPQPAHVVSSNTDLENVDWCALDQRTLHSWPDHCVDLVMLADRHSAQQFGRERWLQEEVRRLFKADGLLHYEDYAPMDPLRDMHPNDEARFWVTPLHGEMSTIVPLRDQDTIAYFTDHSLYRSSLRIVPSLKRVAHMLQGRKTAAHLQLRSHADDGSAIWPPKPRSVPTASMKSALRSSGSLVLDAFARAGTVVERYGLSSRLLRRAAVLSGPAAQLLDKHPPRYLLEAAAKAGIALDHYSWGLVAPADYSSRKLLFFLFNRTRPDMEPSLHYIVKMVRNPDFNARLENERRALTLLHESSIRDHDAIPRVAFAGYHAGLALVGESAIEGVPFHSRTRGDADCPYLHQAIDWLTDLGSATASSGTSNTQAAGVLTTLLDQFLQLYRMTPEHQSFLTRQIERIATSAHRLPAVFQHGDPGLWNLFVTPTGQVAFLDWEAAETAGMPLWDFFHFMRSYSVHAGRARGMRDALQAIQRQLWGDTSLSRVAVEAIRRYRERVELPGELVQPLFYTCWMHRAIKEVSRLTPARIDHGHYVSLLRLCIEQRHTVVSALQLDS